VEENEERKLTRRELLGLAPGAVALALGIGAATGSTGAAGSSATVGPGTVNKIARFISASNIGDSALTDDGSNISASEDLLPSSDNARSIGSSALRMKQVILSSLVQILASASDANPTVKLSLSQLDFGPGGASSVDAYLKRISAGLLETQSLRPQTDNTYSLGTSALRWLDQYLSGTLRIIKTADTTKYMSLYYDSTADVAVMDVVGGPNFAFGPTVTNFQPYTDNAVNQGGSSNRWKSFIASSNFNIFATKADAQPTTNLSSAQLAFGPGGSTVVDVKFRRGGPTDFLCNSNIDSDTDAQRDLGISSHRWRDLNLSRHGIIQGKNALVLDGQSMTQSSHTVSNADTDIVTYSLAANSYTHVIVRVTGYVSFATLSTNQVINLKLKDGTTQVGNTTVVDGAISATSSIPFTLEAVFVETSAVTIHITEGAAAADTATTVFINSIVVLGES